MIARREGLVGKLLTTRRRGSVTLGQSLSRRSNSRPFSREFERSGHARRRLRIPVSFLRRNFKVGHVDSFSAKPAKIADDTREVMSNRAGLF